MIADSPAATRAVPTDAATDGLDGVSHHVLRYELSHREADRASALADACMRRYGDAHEPRFLEVVSVIAHELPRGVREAATKARLADTTHALVIAGNVIDDEALGDTPRHWRTADTIGSRRYAFLLMTYAALLGDAVGWASQQDGRIVTDVLPIPGMERSLVSSSSMTELGWHTEDAFSPHRADHVGLICLRSPDRTSTTIARVDLRALPSDVCAVLRQPRFHVLPDASHTFDAGPRPATDSPPSSGRLNGPRQESSRVCLVAGHPDAPVLCVDRDFTTVAAGDDEAARALQALVSHLDRNLYEVVLCPGDVCFIDNRNVVHGRRPFQPRYDGRDRWLKRVNVVADLRRTRPGRATAAGRVIG
jgi:Fe(II)/alpha-ketoglutarate-dependent arginine beta-hydroxylase